MNVQLEAGFRETLHSNTRFVVVGDTRVRWIVLTVECLRSIEIDNETVFTSDDGVKLKSLPEWVAIIGSGYIGLEFSDVYTALGSDVSTAYFVIPSMLSSLTIMQADGL